MNKTRLVGLWAGLTLVGLGGCAEGGDEVAHPGESIYNRNCFSCHAGGVAGAPMPGDADAWAPRIAKGRAALLASTKAGIAPGMPAMGLCSTCSDEQLEAAIDFMLQGLAVDEG